MLLVFLLCTISAVVQESGNEVEQEGKYLTKSELPWLGPKFSSAN